MVQSRIGLRVSDRRWSRGGGLVIGDIAGWIGVIIAAAALVYTARQVGFTERHTNAQFLDNLDNRFEKYADININLRPGGAWQRAGPQSVEEWARVEAYMGLFERVAVLTELRLVKIQVVRRLYGYRMVNIWANDVIREEKLVRRVSGWGDFIRLTEQLGKAGMKFPGRDYSTHGERTNL
jgi:hypothetical protein